MKKRHPLLFVILLTVLLSVACNQGTRTVRMNNGSETLKIEYKGEIFFNAEGTSIDEISPGGYVKYRSNNKEFIAQPVDSGNVAYKLYVDDHRLNLNDSAAKELFKSAMQEIVEHYER